MTSAGISPQGEAEQQPDHDGHHQRLPILLPLNPVDQSADRRDVGCQARNDYMAEGVWITGKSHGQCVSESSHDHEDW